MAEEKSQTQHLIDLLKFATPAQEKTVRALIEHGSQRKAATALGLARGTVSAHMMDVKRAAAARGVSPEHGMTHAVPEPFVVKGVSTLYGHDGSITSQWVKSDVDSKQLAVMAKKAAAAFFSEQKPLKKSKAPKEKSIEKDLMTVYPLADLHLGMYSWARETGDDYDCDIAVSLVMEGFKKLMDRSPNSEHCVIAQLGDLLHGDDDSNQTRRSGNPLDIDSRYGRVAEVALKVYRAVIDMALAKHGTVHIVNVAGNHDDVSGYWLGVAVETAYENDPRVTVDNQGPYHFHKFGNVLLGLCHGHTCKADALGEIMVADMPQSVGATQYRHWLTGHIHHNSMKEGRICTVESFRTIAAKDAWHHMKGYRSGRDIKSITYHKEWGESERAIVGIREIEKDI